MAIILNDNLQINKGAPVDAKYLNGTLDYLDAAEVNSIIPLTYRHLGLTVRVSGVEYWYQDSIQDSGLVIKGTGADSAGVFIQSATTKSIFPKSGGTVTSSGFYSMVAGGYNNSAIGNFSFSEGYQTVASGQSSHAEGFQTSSFGDDSHSEGSLTIASGRRSHAEGSVTISKGDSSHSEGILTTASGSASHAEGNSTISNGASSHSEGFNTTAYGDNSHAEGRQTNSIGINSHAEGSQTSSFGNNSHSEGFRTNSSGQSSHAEGVSTITYGTASHAEGFQTRSIGTNSHAEGLQTISEGENSHSEGRNTKSKGNDSHSEGYSTYSLGSQSHAEGSYTLSSGGSSHAEGISTRAYGIASHAEGYRTNSSGLYSHSEGGYTRAYGTSSHAEGASTKSYGDSSHAEGNSTISSGESSHSEGGLTKAYGIASHSEGYQTESYGDASHSEGYQTRSYKTASHAEGDQTIASGDSSHSEGRSTIAFGISSHAEGISTIASGNSSHAEGFSTKSYGDNSHSEGLNTIASGDSSHAEGRFSASIGEGSHAEGTNTIAEGSFSHAEGRFTLSKGRSSHAEGSYTLATGRGSHAEGNKTEALGTVSHAEGWYSVASSRYSHAEGKRTLASGYSSHAEGDYTVAGGNGSHAEGYRTRSIGRNSHAEGRFSASIGEGSHAEGFNTRASGDSSHSGGAFTGAYGRNSFAHSNNSFANSDDSAILGGTSNILSANAQRSIILGGQNITGTTPDTVYGINFTGSSIYAENFYSGSTNLSDLLSSSSSSLTIEDEGDNISSGSTNTINFIGTGVTAIQRSSGDGSVIDVYIPAFTSASHWGTNDGITNGTVSENELSRSIKRISIPNGGEGSPFSTGGWGATDQSSSLFSSNVIITSAEDTTGFGGDSTIEVIVYSGDGSIAESFTTPFIVGDSTFNLGNISVSINNFQTDTTRFKAKASVSVDIPSIFTNGGRYHIEVNHTTDSVTDGGNLYSFVQEDVFYDTQTNPVSVDSTSISETTNQVVTKHISGVEYYIIGSQFTVDVENLDFLNSNTIRTNHNLTLVGTDYNLLFFNDLSYSPNNGFISNYTQEDNSVGADYQRNDWSITLFNQRRRSSTSTITAIAKDAWDEGNDSVDSIEDSILIDTFSDNSTDLNETFNGESQRYTNSGFTTNWDSTDSLSQGDALVMGGQMIIPSTATLTDGGLNSDWSSFKPNINGLNPDYTNLNGPSSFFRKFQVSNSDDLNNFSVTFTGEFNGSNALEDLENEDIQIFIRQISSVVPNSQTGPNAPAGILHGVDLYGAGGDWDVTQEGPLRTASSSSNNITASFGAWPAKTGFLCEIRITNTNTKISSIQVTFNA